MNTVSKFASVGIASIALAIPALTVATPVQAADLTGVSAACSAAYTTLSTWTLYRNDTGAATDYRLRVYVKKQAGHIVRVAARAYKPGGSNKRVYVAIKKSGHTLTADAGKGVTDCVTWPNAGGTYLFYGSVANTKGAPVIASNTISITFRR